MDIFSQLAEKIIKEQEVIIGPVALEQARKVSGLEVNDTGTIKINGNGKTVLTDLVKQYAKLFGQTSIEVCREAVREVKTKLSKEDLPAILQ
ncbi:MAG TPA: hypothetical protein VLF20_02265 [Patescibacteria group bacterium]|nr:hypothetical protein [Patescibacteria group bacterium]